MVQESIKKALMTAYKAGVQFELQGNKIHYTAPDGIPASVRQVIKENREQFCAVLAIEQELLTPSKFDARSGYLPITHQQKELFLLQEKDSNIAAYNIPRIFEFNTRLPIEKVQLAWRKLIASHAFLRSSFNIADGDVKCVFHNNITADATYHPIENDKLRDECVDELISLPFNLQHAPLARLHVLQCEHKTTLAFIFHHIVCDNFTVNTLLQQWHAIFTGDLRYATINDQYDMVDYAAYQEQWLSSVDALSQKVYWENKLSQLNANIHLPLLNSKAAQHAGDWLHFSLAASLQKAMEAFSKSNGVTEYAILMAAYTIMLHAFYNEDDIVIGSAYSNRGQTAFGQVKGFLVNPVLFVNNINYQHSPLNFIQSIQNQSLELQTQKTLPFGHVLALAEQEKSVGLKNFIFDYVTGENAEPFILDGHEGREVAFNFKQAKVPLTFSLQKTDQGIAGIIEWQKQFFSTAQAKSFQQHFTWILEQLLEKSLLAEIDFQLPEESQRIARYNNTQSDNVYASIVDQFAAQVLKNPHKVAIKQQGASITYAQLDQHAQCVANYLEHEDVTEGDVIAIALPRSIAMLAAVLGVLKSGAAYLPLDLKYPSERLAYMLNDSEARIVLTDQDSQDKLSACKGPQRCDVVSLLEQSTAQSSASPCAEPKKIKAQSAAYVIYTSGSTGQPKGVVVHHANVNNYLRWFVQQFLVDESAVFDFSTSLSFDLSVTCTLLPLANGAQIVIAADEVKKDPELYLAHLNDNDIAYCKLTPSYFTQLVNFVYPDKLKLLQYIVLGGEYLPSAVVSKWLAHFPEHSLVNEYGPTEATVATSAFTITSENVAEQISGTYPIGLPAHNTEMHVLNKHLKALPIGAVGELFIAGDSVAAGYLNKQQLTEQRFIACQYGRYDRMYKTGDLVAWTNDFGLLYKGRNDDQVKVRGYRIETGEIATRMLRIAGIEHAFVTVKQQAGNNNLVAYYVAQDPAVMQPDVVRAALEKHLPEFMLPKYLVILHAMPLTPNNKIDLNALPQPDLGDKTVVNSVPDKSDQIASQLQQIFSDVLQQPAIGINDDFFKLGGDSISALQVLAKTRDIGLKLSIKSLFEAKTIANLAKELKSQSDNNPAQDKITQQLSTIWQAVLGVETVSRNDDFFKLGGDSITALQMLAKAHEAGLKFAIKDLFEAKTIAKLAPLVKQALATNYLPEASITKRLLPIQSWFFRLNLANPNHWNQAVEFAFPARIDVTHLNAALLNIYNGHDLLRCCFVPQGDAVIPEVLQKVDAFDFLQVVDAKLPLQESAVHELLKQQQEKFAIAQGRLFGALLLRTQDCERLFLFAHHLCVDAVSWQVILRELNKVYVQLRAGKIPDAITESTSPWHLAAKLSSDEYLQSIGSERHFWRSQLQGGFAQLPLHGSVAENLEQNAQELIWHATEKDSAHLLELTTKLNISPQEVLLLAFTQALQDNFSSSRWLVNLEHHGRTGIGAEVDLSQTLGWFTSMYPIAIDLAESKSDQVAQLKKIRQQLKVIPHNGINYQVLKEKGVLPNEQANICFNYLGQVRSSCDAVNELFSIVSMAAGNERAAVNIRPHLLDVNSLFHDGRLCVYWIYPATLLARELMDQLITSFADNLRSLLDVLATQETILVPADFAGAAISQKGVDLLAAQSAATYELAPATPIQQGFLFHHLKNQHSGDYLTQLAWDLTGELDLARYLAAWQSVYDKFTLLRTGFVLEHVDVPHQFAPASIKLPLVEHDWRALSKDAHDKALADLIDNDRRQGFDIYQPPLSRLYVLRLQNNIYKTIWSYDHTIMDGWSLSLMLAKLFKYYEGGVGHNDSVDSQFFEYAKHLDGYINSKRQDAQQFWGSYLNNFDSPTKLPMLLAAEPKQSGGQEIYHTLTEARSEQLRHFSRENSLTMSTLMQACWAIMLAHYAQADDVVFGVTVSGRSENYPNIQKMAGMFINTLPLRIKLRASDEVLSWLDSLQNNMRNVSEYESFSVAELGEMSKKNIAQLINSNVVFENYPVEDKILSNQTGDAVFGQLQVSAPVPYIQSGYPLSLIIIPGKRLGIKITYQTQHFSKVLMQRYAEQFIEVLAQISQCNANHKLSSVMAKLLPASAAQINKEPVTMQTRVTAEQNNTPECVFAGIEHYGTQNPTAIALMDDAGNKLTYQEMGSKVLQLAAHLRDLGVQPNQMVGLCARRSIESVIAMLAINKAGAAYVPIDYTWPQERIDFIVKDTGMQHVVCHLELQPLFQNNNLVCTPLPAAAVHWPFAQVASLSVINQATDLMYVIYTSGSTGNPKGVLIEHGGVSNYVDWATQFLKDNTGHGVLVHSSLNFDITLTAVFPPLLTGHALYIVNEEHGIDGLVAAVRNQPVGKFSLVKLTPSHLSILQNSVEQDLSNFFNTIIVGGEALTAQHLMNIDLNKCQVVNHYGPTEATCGCCANIAIKQNDLDLASKTSIAIGQPIQNMTAYVLDEQGKPVADNEVGELCVAGPGLARGYLNMPEKTAASFVTPDSIGLRAYKTGDLVQLLPNKSLVFVGRKDNQVKFNGYRIELGEIEVTLMQHGDVSKAAVVFKQDAKALAASLVAYVEPGMFEPTVPEIKTFLKAHLPDYMLPTDIFILKTIPTTGSGKIDRQALSELAITNESVTASEIQLPVTAMEETVYKVWVDVFQKDDISTTDNFFEIGGHSLRAVQVIAKLNQVLSLNLPIQILFESLTIAALAKSLESFCIMQQDKATSDQGVVL
jgi:amino acid adenylation domain-containing protein/non-ribosomal peptide synthase protein (TIGR01720 family)